MNSPTLTLPSHDVAVRPASAGCPHLARMSQADPLVARPEPAPARQPAVAAGPSRVSGWWAFRAQALAGGARG
jgi:hypothetical protein